MSTKLENISEGLFEVNHMISKAKNTGRNPVELEHIRMELEKIKLELVEEIKKKESVMNLFIPLS